LVVVPVEIVRRQALAVLRAAGVPEDNAETQASLLIDAELRGVPSHGLLRLARLVHRIGNGVANPTTKGMHTWRGPGFLAVDGERGLGPVVALSAIGALIPRAKDNGVAIAAIANSNHIGMLAWYAEQIAERGFAAIIFTTSEALVHPWGGYKALVGTNPIAVGVPTAGKPFVMDTATGVVSMGKIHDHAHRRAPIPEGWALDAEGNPTTDAERAKHGAISPMAEGKGYALGLAIELFVAALTGAALGTDVKGTLDATEVCNKGDVIIIADPAAGVAQSLSAYLDIVRSTPPATGFERVLIPGDRSAETRETRLRDGLPVADEVWAQLLALTNKQTERGVA
jgi:L-2-hydroxycarboxylate dehydrogenase (NAD+)